MRTIAFEPHAQGTRDGPERWTRSSCGEECLQQGPRSSTRKRGWCGFVTGQFPIEVRRACGSPEIESGAVVYTGVITGETKFMALGQIIEH